MTDRGYQQTLIENLPSEIKLITQRGSCTPETQRRRRKRNIAFRDTISVPTHSVQSTLKEALMKKWNFIQDQPSLGNIFKQPSIISYKKGKSQKDMLVRAKI